MINISYCELWNEESGLHQAVMICWDYAGGFFWQWTEVETIGM